MFQYEVQQHIFACTYTTITLKLGLKPFFAAIESSPTIDLPSCPSTYYSTYHRTTSIHPLSDTELTPTYLNRCFGFWRAPSSPSCCFTAQSMLFLLAVQNFQESFEAAGALTDFYEGFPGFVDGFPEFTTVLNKFIVDNSPLEINIGSKTKARILELRGQDAFEAVKKVRTPNYSRA